MHHSHLSESLAKLSCIGSDPMNHYESVASCALRDLRSYLPEHGTPPQICVCSLSPFTNNYFMFCPPRAHGSWRWVDHRRNQRPRYASLRTKPKSHFSKSVTALTLNAEVNYAPNLRNREQKLAFPLWEIACASDRDRTLARAARTWSQLRERHASRAGADTSLVEGFHAEKKKS